MKPEKKSTESKKTVEPSMEPLAVDIVEGARLCGISRSMMYALIEANRIERLKIGRRSLLRMADLRAFVAGKR